VADIYLGDSRKMKELPDSSVNLIITSPPYYDLKNYNEDDSHTNQLGSPKDYQEYVKNLERVWLECIRVLTPDGKICINIMPIFLSGKENGLGRRETRTMISDIEQFMVSTKKMFMFALYIWDKRKIARFSSFGSYPYPPNIFSTFPYEWIIVFSKNGKRDKVSAEIKEKSKISNKEWQSWAINSIWEMNPARAKSVGHPAPFPEEMPMRLIKLYSFWGDTVLDPFLGSGTTTIVAEKLGRKGVGYEINPGYVELAKRNHSQLDLLID
jgi:DNA modification methylase